MKTTLSLLLLACVLIHQTSAWPLWNWFDDGNTVTTFPTTEEPPMTATTSSPTEEPPTFWTILYTTLKAIFAPVFRKDKSDDPNNISYPISTDEPIQTTWLKTTTDEVEDQGFFQGLFASLANTFASVYERFASQSWENSTQELISNDLSYPSLFAEEVDALFQNYSIPMVDDQELTNLKTSIVDALVSAWNTTLELGEKLVVSHHEIQDKILETLQVAQIFPGEQRSVNGTTITSSTRSPATVNPDEIEATFLEILKKADGASGGISGVSTEPSSDIGDVEEGTIETIAVINF